MSKFSLGKGLDALFPSDMDAREVAVGKQGITEVKIANITPMKGQPRTVFDDDKIEQLSYSIKKHGILQPLVLLDVGGGKFQIIAGERRFRAAQKAGKTHVPAVVRNATELEQLELALIENIQREDLNPIDQAIGVRRLHEDFSQDYATIAKSLGKAESTISNMVRLLSLKKEYIEALRDGLISEGHGRALLALAHSDSAQNTLYEGITKGHWSVRRAELFVSSHKAAKGQREVLKKKMAEQNHLTKELSVRLDNREIKIQRRANGGYLSIYFSDDDDLDKITKSLLS